ncbi:hypothetical protein Ocin01_13254, partial [Orchesella cincta]
NAIEKSVAIGMSNLKFITSYNSTIPTCLISITVSTDGVPLSKSSAVNLWPILVKVDQCIRVVPILVAVYSGETKPETITEFLTDFVNEMRFLEQDGVIVNGTLYFVNVSCVVADAPARAFVIGVKPHTAYHACERCQDDGNWNGRMCFSTRPGLLLERFVSEMEELYGQTSIVYNVHSLLHVHQDALIYGSLDNVSAFPFENYLQKI